MKKTNTIIIAFCLFLIGSTGLKAQQGPSASGGEATGAGGTVSYTIGQTDYITASGSGGTASQGLQQPYLIGVATGIEKTEINLTCAVYPNPTTDYVMLSVQKDDFKTMSFSLYDVTGKVIMNQQLSGNITTVSMIGLADAIYLMKVFNNNNEVKSFKIIKNK